MTTKFDESTAESIPAWRLISDDRELTPEQWGRWYFIRVVVYATLSVAFAVTFFLSSTGAVDDPQSPYDVSALMYRLLAIASGVAALWCAFQLTICALGLIAARRRRRRRDPHSRSSL